MEKVKNEYEKVATAENGNKNEKQEETFHYGYGVRHIQVLLIFSSLCTAYVGRAHLGVTVVAMVEDPNKSISNNLSQQLSNVTGNYTHEFEGNKTMKDFVNGTFEDEVTKAENTHKIWNVYKFYNWPKPIQDMVLGSFFVGYSIMMFPMGLVCQKWGGKLPLQIALIMTAIVSILSPWLAVWGGWKAVCVSRIVTGLTQAGIYPSIHTLIAKWVPLSERGRLGTYIYIGSMTGTIIAFQIGGFLASSPWGWPSTFWVTGILSVIMFGLLTVFGAASPLEHKTISQDEKNFILGRVSDGVEKKLPTPWKAMLTSKPVWATFMTHIGHSMAFVFFFTQIPSYLHFIQNVDIKSSGVLSSLPYFANFTTSLAFGYISDYCTNRQILTIKQARIISNTIASVGPALCLACISYTSNTTLAVICLVTALGTHAGGHTGWMVSYIDMAPNFSGALMATGNTITNIMAVTLPMIISNIVTDVTNPLQWRIVLFLLAGFILACNAVYVLFMSSDLQPWNESGYLETGKEDKEMQVLKETNNKSNY